VKGEVIIIKPIGFIIKLINDSIVAQVNLFLKPYEVTLRQLRILGYLHDNKDKLVTQKELEEELQVSHPTVVGLLKRLEKKGLIQTFLNPNKKTMKIVTLIEYEAELFKNINKEKEKFENKLLTGFTDAEKVQLEEFLIRLHRNVNS
jgi:MarR family multiple gene transcriptional regulator MgrA